MGTTSFNFNFYKIKQICNIIEHNPVYYTVFKYHKFTQIVPTKSAVFAQFFANPKSQKFLKLNFHVFGSRKSYESKINFIWRVKKIVIKLFFRFWNPIQMQKTIWSQKKISFFFARIRLKLGIFCSRNVISAISVFLANMNLIIVKTTSVNYKTLKNVINWLSAATR